jgi:hypothetical protein
VKNASKAIRTAFKNVLSGITYGGYTIPVYENLPVNTTGDYYIELTTITDTNDANDAKFIRSVVINVEVYVRQNMYQNYDAVEEISEDVMQRVLPFIGGGGSSMSSNDFQIGHIQLESTRILDERDTNGEYITRKILTFNQLLIQY